jgi:hypothetical protein
VGPHGAPGTLRSSPGRLGQSVTRVPFIDIAMLRIDIWNGGAPP